MGQIQFLRGASQKDGFQQIATIFQETAKTRGAHAKIWYKYIMGGMGSTEQNLEDSAKTENYEWTQMYKQFAEEAKRRDLTKLPISLKWWRISKKTHEARYNTLHENIQEGKVFSRNGGAVWVCKNCGYIYEGDAAPEVCPVCAHKKPILRSKQKATK